MLKLKVWLAKLLFGGVPISPNQAIWELIDAENKKPENEIRCDYIEAWMEAAKRVRNVV